MSAPIGIFDSGVGGLTVVRALVDRLPDEPLLYLGDTARVPYGTKSAGVVRRYAHNCSKFLIERGAKIVVVACNTASAVAIPSLAEAFELPVIGVIEPGANLAAQRSATGRIGVIGTEGTIRSGRYQELIRAAAPNAQVITGACPLLVPLAEEGMTDHAATRIVANEYLAPLLAENIDTLVLGCTHYPVLRELIQEICGESVTIIDSATAVAESVAQLLEKQSLSATSPSPQHRFYATDVSQRLERVGSLFLGKPLGEVELVDV